MPLSHDPETEQTPATDASSEPTRPRAERPPVARRVDMADEAGIADGRPFFGESTPNPVFENDGLDGTDDPERRRRIEESAAADPIAAVSRFSKKLGIKCSQDSVTLLIGSIVNVMEYDPEFCAAMRTRKMPVINVEDISKISSGTQKQS